MTGIKVPTSLPIVASSEIKRELRLKSNNSSSGEVSF